MKTIQVIVLIAIMYVSVWCEQNKQAIIIITPSSSHKIILNLQDSYQLMLKRNVKLFTIKSQDENKIQFNKLKQFIQSINVTKDQISSFLTSYQMMQNFKKNKKIQFSPIDMKQLPNMLIQNEELTYLFHVSTNPRILHPVEQENQSKLFSYMTPQILSGLLASLFLIIMLLIGVNCLYNINTNYKFGKNNLWVGKQS